MTDRYAVIGFPIGHSKSPAIHAAFARNTGQQLEYHAVAGEPGRFAATVDRLRAEGYRGLNVTLPFKIDACRYATTLHDSARDAGAANCLAFAGSGCEAHNFDGVGLVRDIVVNLGAPIAGRRVLLLGAGGAARGALPAILAERPGSVTIANRTPATAQALAAPHGGAVEGGGLAVQGAFEVVINATSASLSGAELPLPPGAFAPGCLAYDMVYGLGPTPFLRAARAAGAGRVADGVGMLVEQAAEAFLLWRGVRPETAQVIAELTIPVE